jgi:hypothetical protein
LEQYYRFYFEQEREIVVVGDWVDWLAVEYHCL